MLQSLRFQQDSESYSATRMLSRLNLVKIGMNILFPLPFRSSAFLEGIVFFGFLASDRSLILLMTSKMCCAIFILIDKPDDPCLGTTG